MGLPFPDGAPEAPSGRRREADAGAHGRRAVELAVGRTEHVLDARADSGAVRATGFRIAAVLGIIDALAETGASLAGNSAAGRAIGQALAGVAMRARRALHGRAGIGRRRVALAGRASVRIEDVAVLAEDLTDRRTGRTALPGRRITVAPRRALHRRAELRSAIAGFVLPEELRRGPGLSRELDEGV